MSESEANSSGWRGTDEGTRLKSIYGWYDGGNGTDDFGFSALPGGGRFYDGGFYFDAGDIGYWWSSSPYSGSAWYRGLFDYSPELGLFDRNPRFGFSVRCLKDAD